MMRHATRSRAADGSTARLWALGIVRLTSRRRSRELFIPDQAPRPLGQRILSSAQMRELVGKADAEIRDVRGCRRAFPSSATLRLPGFLAFWGGDAASRGEVGEGGLQVPSIFGYRGITGSNM